MSQFAILNNDVSGTGSTGGDLTLQAGVRVRVLQIHSFLHERGTSLQAAVITADGLQDSVVVLMEDLDLEPVALPVKPPLPRLTRAPRPLPSVH